MKINSIELTRIAYSLVALEFPVGSTREDILSGIHESRTWLVESLVDNALNDKRSTLFYRDGVPYFSIETAGGVARDVISADLEGAYREISDKWETRTAVTGDVWFMPQAEWEAMEAEDRKLDSILSHQIVRVHSAREAVKVEVPSGASREQVLMALDEAFKAIAASWEPSTIEEPINSVAAE
ncbi:MAG: hypothetical protein KDN22_07965 [Verrucomicrobiae bacterium]|nr:hypothetical protein [Verrucomicrobiae bacterium]